MKLKIILFLLTLAFTGYSQTWQWGKQGGGADAFNYTDGHENVRRMATDAQGNVFVISTVSQTALAIDGVPKTHYGQSSLMENGALASFSCTGAYRWSKIIGGETGGRITDVQTDSQGNVYIIGYLPAASFGTPNHFDEDLILPYCTDSGGVYANCRTFYIAKYSNSGILLWTKFPEADNIFTSATDGTGGVAIDMSIDSSNNLFILCYLYPGTYANGIYVNNIPNATYHVLQYNAQGNFVSGLPLNMSAYGMDSTVRMARNEISGNFYLSGYNFTFQYTGPIVNGIQITKPMFVVAFNAQGNYLWKVENTDSLYGQLHDIALDTDGNIYVTGGTKAFGNSSGEPGDTFAGQVFLDEYDNAGPVPFVVKLNPSGQAIWSSNASYSGGGIHAKGIVINGNEVAIATDVALLKWSGQEVGTTNANNQGTNAAIVRLNKSTGVLLGMSDIQSNSLAFDRVGCIAADVLGNYYLGGEFAQQLFTGSTTLLNSGSESDFFVAKYGTSNCTLAVEEQEIQQLKVYPNPTKDKVQVETTEDLQYTIFNLMGSVMAHGNLAVQNNSIDVNTLANGCYVLQFQNDKGEFRNLKLIKE